MPLLTAHSPGTALGLQGQQSIRALQLRKLHGSVDTQEGQASLTSDAVEACSECNDAEALAEDTSTWLVGIKEFAAQRASSEGRLMLTWQPVIVTTACAEAVSG